MSDTTTYEAAVAACPTPAYHETHRYCPSCPWTEEGPLEATKPAVRDIGSIRLGLHDLAQQMRANSERWFPGLHGGGTDLRTFYALGLAGEAGEVANVAKKMIRVAASAYVVHADRLQEMADDLAAEMADVFTYLLLLADECGVDLVAEYLHKVEVNEERWGA